MGCRHEILHSLMDDRMPDHSWNFRSGAVCVMVFGDRIKNRNLYSGNSGICNFCSVPLPKPSLPPKLF